MHRKLQSGDTDTEMNTRITVVPVARDASVRHGADCLVVISAPHATELGKRYELDDPVVSIGRSRDNDIVLSSDCVSRQHVRIEKRDGDYFGVDMRSTNGTFINDEAAPFRERRLVPGDLLKVGDTIFKYLSGSDVEAQYHQVIFAMTITDGLTNLANRKQLDATLADELLRAQRHSRDLSVLMLDIDHFKRINDTYGHGVGDAVLRHFAGLMQKRMRPTDKIGRYGGEEFCAILPETDLEQALSLAEELRERTAAHPFNVEQRQVPVTVSIGASSYAAGMRASDLYSHADRMLYKAKHEGRNCVRG